MNKDTVKSWKNSSNKCLESAYEYWEIRSCDHCYDAQKNLMMARAQMDMWTGYENACYPTQSADHERCCLEETVNRCTRELRCCREQQTWMGYPNEKKLEYKYWRAASILGTHGDCMSAPLLLIAMADEYNFACCKCSALKTGMKQFMVRMLKFVHGADFTQQAQEAGHKITLNIEAMAPCRGSEGRYHAQWRKAVMKAMLSVLLELKADPEMSGIMSDFENPNYARDFNLIASPDLKKVCHESYSKLQTCMPHIVCHELDGEAEETRYIHVMVETCDNLCGKGGECMMMPTCGLDGDACDTQSICDAMDAALGSAMPNMQAAAAVNANGCCATPQAWQPSGNANSEEQMCLESCSARVQQDLMREQKLVDVTITTMKDYLTCWCNSRTKCHDGCSNIKIYSQPTPTMTYVDEHGNSSITPTDKAERESTTLPYDATAAPRKKECYPTYMSMCGHYPSIKKSSCMEAEEINNTALMMVTGWARQYKPWKVKAYRCKAAECPAEDCPSGDATQQWVCDTDPAKGRVLESQTMCGNDVMCSVHMWSNSLMIYIMNMKVLHPLYGKSQEQLTALGVKGWETYTGTGQEKSQFLEYKYVKISDFISNCCVMTYVSARFADLHTEAADGFNFGHVMHHLQGSGDKPTDYSYYNGGRSNSLEADYDRACKTYQPAYEDGSCYVEPSAPCAPTRCCQHPYVCLHEPDCGNCMICETQGRRNGGTYNSNGRSGSARYQTAAYGQG